MASGSVSAEQRHRHPCQHRHPAKRADPGADHVGELPHRDPAQGSEHMGDGHQRAGGRGGPAPLVHQPGQREGPHQELRHHQQHGDAVHPHQEPIGPVGVRGQGRGRGRSWRIEHDQEHGTEREGHGRDRDPESRLHARTIRGDRDRRRGNGNSEWLRHLADPHGEPASLGREPAHHYATAGGAGAGREHPHHEQDRAQGDRPVDRRCHNGQGGGPGQSREQHGALTDPVHRQPPEEQGDHHAGDRHRRDGSGLGE